MARRATEIDRHREHAAAFVLVDGGGFTGQQSASKEPRSLFLAETMKVLGYDATTFGGEEARLGANLLRALAADESLPAVSANLIDSETGERLLPAGRIVEKNGVRVGITAVTQNGADLLASVGIETRNPRESLQDVLPDLRADSDVVILLARMGLSDAKKLSASLSEEIDVIVVADGRPGRGVVYPETGGSLYLQAGGRGQAMGLARIRFDSDRRLEMIGNEITLSREIEEEPEMLATVETFLKTINELARAQATAVPAVERATPDGHYFVGVESCRSCHAAEYEVWSETPHAAAFSTLVVAQADALPECYGCHVTGHGDPAGYDPTVAGSESLLDVQCEVCHDKGSRHTRDGGYGSSLLMETCVSCHNAENSPDFDLEVYWLMMEH